MSREGQPELERSSSFARSFFQAGQGNDGTLDSYGSGPPNMGAAMMPGGGGVAVGPGPGGVGPEGVAAAVGPPAGEVGVDGVGDGSPGPGMRRQRSRRRLSRGGSGRNLMREAAAAAAAVSYEEGEPTQNLPHVGGDPGRDRQTSWYTDALLQGGTEDLSAILGEAGQGGGGVAGAGAGAGGVAAVAANDNHAEDDEVLEQYRIMAHVEANIRVRDNTGFDMAEYEKRRKMMPEQTKGDYYSGNRKPKPRLPEPRMLGGAGQGGPGIGPGGGGGGGPGVGGMTMQKPEEPPLPPPRANKRFVEQRPVHERVPELSPGAIVRGQSQVPEGEHIVRCLGCKSQLSVSTFATLVNCEDCLTVSPASSTRR